MRRLVLIPLNFGKGTTSAFTNYFVVSDSLGEGGTASNLQETTDAGATTTNPITIGVEDSKIEITDNSIRHDFEGNFTELGFINPTGENAIQFQDKSGIIAFTSDIDDAIEGIKLKQPVRVATTANITLSGTQTIDSIALSVDDRVLVKDQTTESANGIYLVKSGSWERSGDANTATELTNAVVSVLEGTANGQSTYRQITTSITLGSSNIVWQTFGVSVPDATSSTKGKMKLFADLLNSYTDGSVTQAAIVAALGLKADKATTAKVLLMDTTPLGSPIAGGTNVKVKSWLIPANTIIEGAKYDIEGVLKSIGTNGQKGVSLYVNTTDTTASATEIGKVGNFVTGTNYLPIKRQYILKSGNLECISTSFVNPTDESMSVVANNVFGTYAFDRTIDNYIMIGTTFGNASDTFNLHSFEITETLSKTTI